MTSVIHEPTEAAADRIDPGLIHDAHRDVLLAVQRGLAANWDSEVPRIAVVERDTITIAYISTVATVEQAARADIRGMVRAALAPYTSLAPLTNVVFLTRGRP